MTVSKMKLTRRGVGAAFAAVLASLSLLFALAGCMAQGEDLPDGQSSDSVETPSLVVSQGTNTVRVSTEDDVAELMEVGSDEVSVDYGWGTVRPSSVDRVDDRTLEVSFTPESVEEDVPSAAQGYDGSISLETVLSASDDPFALDLPIDIERPALSCSSSVSAGSDGASLHLTIDGASFAQTVDPSDVVLSGAFAGMEVSSIERAGDNQIVLNLDGSVGEQTDDGVPFVSGGVAISPRATDAALFAYGLIEVGRAGAYLTEEPSFDGQGRMVVSISLEGCSFAEGADARCATPYGALSDATVLSLDVDPDDPTHAVAVLSADRSACEGVGGVTLSADATTYGDCLGVDIDFESIGFFPVSTSLQAQGDRTLLVATVRPVGVSLSGDLDPSDVQLTGEFSEASFVGAERLDDGQLAFSLSFDNEVLAALAGNGGGIRLPVSSVSSEYANVDADDAVVWIGEYKEDDASQASCGSLAAEPASFQANWTGSTLTTQASFGDSAVTALVSWVKSGLTSLANKGFGKASSTILEFLGWSNEDPVLGKLEDLDKKMSELGNQVKTIDSEIKSLISSVNDASFRDQMTDVENAYDSLRPRLVGYQASFDTLMSEEGDPSQKEAYEAGSKSLASQINAGWDLHASTITLGLKILSGSAGTSDGALKAHTDWMLSHCNWESQTYEERERFYVYLMGTYLQAASLDAFALRYQATNASTPSEVAQANAYLDDLEKQVKSVSDYTSSYTVKRLDTAYDYNLRTGVYFSTDVQTETYTMDNPLWSRADSFHRFRVDYAAGKAKCGGPSTPGGYESNYYELPELGLISKQQAAAVMSFSSCESLMDELRSARSFTISDGAPSDVATCDFNVRASFFRSGTGLSFYTYVINYIVYDKSAREVQFDVYNVADRKADTLTPGMLFQTKPTTVKIPVSVVRVVNEADVTYQKDASTSTIGQSVA